MNKKASLQTKKVIPCFKLISIKWIQKKKQQQQPKRIEHVLPFDVMELKKLFHSKVLPEMAAAH